MWLRGPRRKRQRPAPGRHQRSPLQGHPGSPLRQGAGTWPEASAHGSLCPQGPMAACPVQAGCTGIQPLCPGSQEPAHPSEGRETRVTHAIHTRVRVTLTKAPPRTRLMTPTPNLRGQSQGRGRGHQASGGCLPSGACAWCPRGPWKGPPEGSRDGRGQGQAGHGARGPGCSVEGRPAGLSHAAGGPASGHAGAVTYAQAWFAAGPPGAPCASPVTSSNEQTRASLCGPFLMVTEPTRGPWRHLRGGHRPRSGSSQVAFPITATRAPGRRAGGCLPHHKEARPRQPRAHSLSLPEARGPGRTRVQPEPPSRWPAVLPSQEDDRPGVAGLGKPSRDKRPAAHRPTMAHVLCPLLGTWWLPQARWPLCSRLSTAGRWLTSSAGFQDLFLPLSPWFSQ